MPLTWILLALFGPLLGWLASVVIRARSATELLLLALTGLAGALFGALVLTPPIAGRLEWSGFSLPGLLFSLLGSLLLLGAACAILRRKRRAPPSSGA
jgi:uncharacterized membrane protein YeaQ/YmgE (transglycosylase-associated protein family)